MFGRECFQLYVFHSLIKLHRFSSKIIWNKPITKHIDVKLHYIGDVKNKKLKNGNGVGFCNGVFNDSYKSEGIRRHKTLRYMP